MRPLVLFAVALGGIAVGAILVSGTLDEPAGAGGGEIVAGRGSGTPTKPSQEQPGVGTGPAEPDPAPLPSRAGAGRFADLRAVVEADPRSPRTQRELAGFVVMCREAGPACVAEVATFLASGADVRCDRSWNFKDGELSSFPSLRSACIEALRAVDTPAATAALRRALSTSPGAGDGYLVARALHERGERDWEGAALTLARGEETRGDGADRVRSRIVALAATSDPEETARHVYDDATRGQGRKRPAILAAGLGALPQTLATSVGQGLLDDATVTARAKGACVEGLLGRGDLASWQVVGTAVTRSGLDDDTRLRAVEVAISSPHFGTDARTLAQARREGDTGLAREVESRYRARLEETERMALALWPDAAARAGRPARETFAALERLRRALGE